MSLYPIKFTLKAIFFIFASSNTNKMRDRLVVVDPADKLLTSIEYHLLSHRDLDMWKGRLLGVEDGLLDALDTLDRSQLEKRPGSINLDSQNKCDLSLVPSSPTGETSDSELAAGPTTSGLLLPKVSKASTSRFCSDGITQSSASPAGSTSSSSHLEQGKDTGRIESSELATSDVRSAIVPSTREGAQIGSLVVSNWSTLVSVAIDML